MNEIVDSGAQEPSTVSETAPEAAGEDASRMGRRLFRLMLWTVVVAVGASAFLLPWRVTVGLLIGGALSLLNHHWMRTAISAAFNTASSAQVRPKIKVVRFITRYFIVAAAVVAADQLNIASLTAMLVGLCSFAVAALIEGFMQTYFAIINREETK